MRRTRRHWRAHKLPEDFADYKDAFSNIGTNGDLRNYHRIDEIADTLKEGRAVVEQYTRENLEDATTVNTAANTMDTVSAIDGWSISADAADKKVTGKIELKYKIVDGKNDVYGPLYYVVRLEEKIRHFFLPGWFDAMNAPVRAVVLLKPHYKGLIEPMQQLERTMVIDNWEYTDKYKDVYTGKWNHYMAGTTADNTGIDYKNNNPYRTENITVSTIKMNRDGGQPTSANGGKFYSENEVDSLNLDFQAEVDYPFQSDWDLGQAVSGQKYKHVEGGNSWGLGHGDDKRIHYNVKIDDAWETRPSKKGGYDPLWVRIESEPMKNPYPGKTPYYNISRQIVLNFNETNVDEDDPYKYRPYVFFYTGPETRDYAVDKNGVRKRHSQPVVINLNEDLNVIFYMPESPVVIHGNGHKLMGFVIAKCFLQSLTSDDMTNRQPIYRWDGFNEKTEFRGNYTEGVDGYGNTIYVKSANLLTLEDIRRDNNGCKELTEADNGTIKYYENFVVPEYPVIGFTKEMYKDCKTLADYFQITADYINATYTKENYAKFAGIAESEVSMIKFPDEKDSYYGKYGNFTAVTIPVATADLKDADPDPDAAAKDDKYVKVMLGDTPKYIAKQKLPYMQVKWNANYPYVCLYDLKTDLGWGMESQFVCVKPMDNTNSTSDSAIVFTNSKNQNVPGSNQWGDVWVINSSLLSDTYNKQYKPQDMELFVREGIKYFSLKTDLKQKDTAQLMNTYRQVKLDENDFRYINEDSATEYYMKVSGDETHPENYIIVDRNGNILTKPVTSPEVLTARNVDANTTLKKKVDAIFSRASDKPLIDYWKTYTRNPKDPAEIPGDRGGTTDDGQYVGLSEYRMNEDYRIPALERVYKAHDAFNLSTDSMYSYFQIPELWRVNYTYLNVDTVNHIVNRKDAEESGLWKVDDMFFTKERAAWID